MSIKDFLSRIPNSVSGDGKTFVSLLKQFLVMFENVTDEKLDSMSVGGAEQLIGLTLMETHATDSNGMPQNNIVVEFDTTNVTNFSTAQIWLSSDDGKTFQQTGTTGGLKYVIEKVTAGVTYTVKAIAVNTSGGSSDADKAPQAAIRIKGSVLVPDAPKQFVLTWDDKGPLWQWLHEDNGYVDFFELRLDGNAGVYDDKLLDRVRDLKSRANPNVRSGTAYLFVRNIFGTYSLPATHQFGKELGAKPEAPSFSALLSGVNIKLDPLPAGYTNYKLIINGEDFTSKNNEFVYFLKGGTITAKYCFVDDIGDGEYSDEVTADVKKLIEAADIAEGAIGENQLADSVITATKISANAITADKIEAGSVTADKIETGSITTEKIAVGAVKADNIQAGSVIGDHISAGAITTEKLAAANIDLLGALAIVGGSVRLDETGLRLNGGDGSYTLFNAEGINYIDASGVVYAQVKKMIIGTAYDGQYIKFAATWARQPQIMVSPTSLLVNSADYSQNNISLVCKAIDVSASGFGVRCYTALDSGSSGLIALNKVMNNFMETGAGDQYTVANFEIVVPSSATSINVFCSVTNDPWTTGGEYKKGHGFSSVRVTLSGTGVTNGSYYYKSSVDGSRNMWNKSFSVSANLSNTTKVIFTMVISATDTNNYNDIRTGGFGYSIPNATIDVDGSVVISRGYANFIVTDGSTNTYTIEG